MSADSYYNLKILYKNGRVKLLKTKVKIYFGNDEKFKFANIKLSEFYRVFDPMRNQDQRYNAND